MDKIAAMLERAEQEEAEEEEEEEEAPAPWLLKRNSGAGPQTIVVISVITVLTMTTATTTATTATAATTTTTTTTTGDPEEVAVGPGVFADPLFVSYLHSNIFKHLKGTRSITPQSTVPVYSQTSTGTTPRY